MATAAATRRRRRSPLLTILRWVVAAATLTWLSAAVSLVAFRYFDPPTSAVQVERRLQSWIHNTRYAKRYTFVPLGHISPNLQHAVIAAEDARFYQHHGFDWKEIHAAVEDDLDDRRVRGASTITQQLVKNLFFGTGRSYVRKGIEATLVPVAEFVLGKQRILEIYLNVVEWGPGVYGAEAAAQYHYSTTARNVDRPQAVRLAAILPNPLRRRPDRMTKYRAVIDTRMRQVGW